MADDQSQSDEMQYTVLINDEEQYSLWPKRKAVPNGWREVGTTGTKEFCVDYVDKHWTDMRPRSLREEMAAAPVSSNSAEN